jgi:ABC-type lipoprotein release transport system permease subunit
MRPNDEVRAVVLRVRGALRRRWRSAAIVAVIVAIASGAVLTLLAGARRTAGAPAAFTKYVGGDADADVQQQFGPPLTDQIAAVPGVASVNGVTFMFAASDSDAAQRASSTLVFAGRPLQSRVVAGRQADPAHPHEFVADRSYVAQTHAHLGDRYHFVSWSRTQAEHGQGYQGKPLGPGFEGTLVGIVDTADQLDSNYSINVFPASLLHADIGTVATIMTVDLKPGVTRAQLRAGLDRMPGGSALIVDTGQVVSAATRNAVNAQAVGIWVLALVASATALIALGQLLSRHARLPDVDRDALFTLGFTRLQLIAETTAFAAVPALVGIAAGVGIAIGASGIFPLSFVRKLEPHPGIHVDGDALAVGALLLFVALVAWVGGAVLVVGFRSRRPRSTNDIISRQAPTPAAAIGARFALSSRGRSSFGTMAVLAIVIIGVVGATAFAVSLDRLVGNRDRFGGNYDFQIGDNSDLQAKDLRKLEGDRDIAAMMIVTGDHARSGGTTVDIVGVEQAQGALAPHLLSGRQPAGPDEIALGRSTARQLHLRAGDTLDLVHDDGDGHIARGSYRVVGLVVVPTIAGNDGVGKGALMTAPGFARLTQAPESTMAAIELRSGAPAAAQARIAHRLGQDDNTGTEDPPGSIVNVARVRPIPPTLGGLLAGLLLLAMFHAIVVSVRERRQDLAVLSALGADRRFIGRAVHWQTTILVALPLAVGIPLGLVAGSKIFRAFTDRIGAVPDPALPFALVAIMTVALLLVANVVAFVPTRQARRFSTATLLRAD